MSVKVIVGSQHPLYNHVYTTTFGNKRYDCNVRDEIVWESMRKVGSGFKNVTLSKDSTVHKLVLTAVKNHIKSK